MFFIRRIKEIMVFHMVEQAIVEMGYGIVEVTPEALDSLIMN